MKKLIALFVLFAFLFFGCISNSDSVSSSDSKLIMTSFFPIQEMVSFVAKDKFTVSSLVPSGVEPHDFEPTSSDLRKLSSAKAYFALGLDFSPFENSAKTSFGANSNYYEISKNVSTIITNGKTDPHIWLSPKRMKVVAHLIHHALEDIDPNNEPFYSKNANDLESRLDSLDRKFERGLAFCNKSTIITSHAAFGYLASDYNFTQIGISGLDPETEPTPSQIREIIDVAREENLKYIFYEELTDSRVSRAIASEANIEVLELNPIEGSKDSKSYFDMMEDNLENLRIALECS